MTTQQKVQILLAVRNAANTARCELAREPDAAAWLAQLADELHEAQQRTIASADAARKGSATYPQGQE